MFAHLYLICSCLTLQVSAVALAKLLEHGVTANDARLQGIIVQGDQVRHRTREGQSQGGLDMA